MNRSMVGAISGRLDRIEQLAREYKELMSNYPSVGVLNKIENILHNVRAVNGEVFFNKKICTKC